MEGNEKTKLFTEKIDNETRAAKAQTTRKEVADNLREAFNKPKPDSKTTMNEDFLSKVRKEAQTAREKVPPEFGLNLILRSRLELFIQKTQPQRLSKKRQFQHKQTKNFEKPKANEVPVKKPRNKMSSTFNKVAYEGYNKAVIKDKKHKPEINLES